VLKKSILILFCLSLLSCSHTSTEPRDILPRSSFLHLNKILSIFKCEKDKCVSKDFKSAASAFVVKVINDGSFAITAAHVCEDKVPSSLESPTTRTSAVYKIRRLDGKEYTASVLTYDIKIDVCLMFVKDLTEGIEAVEISPTKPQPGDRLYNIAAPIAIFRPNMVPIIEGRYSGETENIAWYTLLAAPGSSGSMVLNEKGQLVGLVHSVYVRFPTITLGVRYDDLVSFIATNLNKYVVYKDVMDVLGLKNVFES